MKAISLLVLLVAVSTAQASNFKCSEKASDAIAKSRRQYGVVLESVAPVSKYKDGYDLIERVRVSVLSRLPLVGGSRLILDRAPFEAIAKSEDVNYNINAKDKHGFSLGIYLDELDQSWMKLKGVAGDIRLKCSSKN